MIKQRAHDLDYIDEITKDAVNNCHLLLLEYLYSIGVKINQASSVIYSYDTPLHSAIHHQDLEFVKFLIQHGANCNIPNKNGETPLFYAFYAAMDEIMIDIVRALVVEGGASLNVHNEDCRVVIEWAKEWKERLRSTRDQHVVDEIVQYLEERLRINHESTSEEMTHVCVSSSEFSELLHKWHS